MKNVIIMGAAGRDFHNYNVFFCKNKKYKVVAFTATQIPDISGRKYPKELAGKRSIPIYEEAQLEKLVKKFKADVVVLAYSDLSHKTVMHKASRVLATGADFWLLGPQSTYIKSKKRVIAVCAVRTGCGKSQTTRKVCEYLDKAKKKYVVVRHPMPYGVLKNQIVERFETMKDLDKYKCTIEEREEYEPHIAAGHIVYAGVDYEKILRAAEKEADVIVWDGGNNDLPFFKPDLHIVLADALRAGHELSSYPGEANLRMADIVIINKVKAAKKSDVELVENNVKSVNPTAKIIKAASKIKVYNPERVRNKKVIVVEDGPTLTHGGMKFGAGTIAALSYNATLVDPRPYAKGSIKKVYKDFKVGKLLPAMGYSPQQRKELQQTINACPADSVVVGTPIRLDRFMRLNKPIVKVEYELDSHGQLGKEIRRFLKKRR